MRRNITHILVVCSLLLLLIATGCGPEAEEARVIKIGVIGPMQFVQGEHHWYGAVLARDEINDAGGVKIGEDTYTIELIKADSNEILSPSDSAAAMERLITVDNADFVVGGSAPKPCSRCRMLPWTTRPSFLAVVLPPKNYAPGWRKTTTPTSTGSGSLLSTMSTLSVIRY